MASASDNATATYEEFHAALPTILSHIPQEWRGTTFKNSSLLGRELFAKKLLNLISIKSNHEDNSSSITTEDLINLGNAEDYLRVASNISCVLEAFLALSKNLTIEQVFSFASSNLSIIAVGLTSSPHCPIHVYLGDDNGSSSPFTEEHLAMLKLLSVEISLFYSSIPTRGEETNGTDATSQIPVILAYESIGSDVFTNPAVDGIIGNDGILFIKETSKIVPAKILTIRKRLSTPMTSPVAENKLHLLAGTSDYIEPSYDYTEEELLSFQSHLQHLSGTIMNLSSTSDDAPTSGAVRPICFTAGLPSICSLWMTLIATGGADIVMASTAYGGSSELTDIMTTKAANFKKHKFDITGQLPILPAIQATLETLQTRPSSELQGRTVVFLEIPTNPDMKVPDMIGLATLLTNYRTVTGKDVLLLIDTTFAPGSQVLLKVESQFPDLPCMVFISMSKSISRGVTTAGALVAGSSADSRNLLQRVQIATRLFDTTAKPDQMRRLIDNHVGVEDRCDRAYQNAVYLGKTLQQTATQLCHGHPMPLAFVTEENAAIGFTSSTFSFNLPPVSAHHPVSDPNHEAELNANLAQQFVDLLCVHSDVFKPCVSFGQDNGLVYATVPATSTQGAIHPDDKAKQAIGGVQLTRLSFPPTCDLMRVEELLKTSLEKVYEVEA
jgi:cystathionine beta-lyase/cystathionine gamma-synthase